MDATRAQEALSSTSRCTYHVFLSFRGEDTRKTFTDHLYTALLQAGFHTFRDDDEIERGHNIESELQKALQQSKISIIVFSKGYAFSRWCLDELVQILEHKRNCPHVVVLPIFYDVFPSQVRKQADSFAEAFASHEEQFKEENTKGEKQWTDKVEGWKAALREAADLAGMVLQNQADGHESKFIQQIVQEIGNKLNQTLLSVAPYIIGLESRVREINSWLHDGSSDVRKVVIYGIGGIGKTTLAKTVYNLNFENFEAKSFLANVREISAQPNGFLRLQKQLISDILKGRKEKIYNIDEGIFTIEEATCCKRVLLVLDDVDHEDQLRNILGWRQWFRRGSKIIITSRHEQLLKSTNRCKMFEVKKLDGDESLQLFSWHAFGQSHPIKEYKELLKRVLHHCGGLPLALQIVGSSLFGKSVETWKSALEKLEAIPDSQIQKVLKISFDSLSDDHDKNLFLDIACFFIGKGRDDTVKILDECGFYTTIGIQNLIGRCLVTISNDDKLMMHQLLRDMGREIIRQESPKEPGKRSRLWCHKDSFDVLREVAGTETVEGLILDLHELRGDKLADAMSGVHNADHHNTEQFLDTYITPSHHKSSIRRSLWNCWNSIRAAFSRYDAVSNELHLNTDAFARMHKLRLLQLNYVQLIGGYEKLPNALRSLSWHGFPSKTIPSNFHLEKLVALDMRNSSLEQIWKGTRVRC
ncbi:unnamed protein product [Ilex paraguariensis]|uniref:TIR domain-containing protein n=1 Tax=Ilex paraguariensis TaxID=185542 RepID=A0ABC8UE52_9AQUA